MKRRIFHFFIIVAINLSIIMGIFLMAEIALRVFDLPFYGSHFPFIYKDTYIRKYIPNEPYEYKKEGYSKGRFNSHGFLDYERSLAKPNNAFRVAVIGDSLTAGIEVAMEHRFCSLMEKTLSRHYNRRFEVMNFAISGYATGDEYILLKSEVMEYDPDIVILVFFSSNDIEGNYSGLEPVKRRFYFDIDENNNLILDDTYYKEYLNSREGRLRLLLDGKSRVARALLTLYRDLLTYRKRGRAADVVAGYAKMRLALFDNALSEDYKRAWEITEELLFNMKEYVESRNARFILASIPNGIQFLPAKGWSETMESRDKPEQILRQISKRKGIDYLDILPLFESRAKGSGKIPYFHEAGSYGHLNETGHRWTSEALCEYIYKFQD